MATGEHSRNALVLVIRKPLTSQPLTSAWNPAGIPGTMRSQIAHVGNVQEDPSTDAIRLIVSG
jgi:hypothetical protein